MRQIKLEASWRKTGRASNRLSSKSCGSADQLCLPYRYFSVFLSCYLKFFLKSCEFLISFVHRTWLLTVELNAFLLRQALFILKKKILSSISSTILSLEVVLIVIDKLHFFTGENVKMVSSYSNCILSCLTDPF